MHSRPFDIPSELIIHVMNNLTPEEQIKLALVAKDFFSALIQKKVFESGANNSDEFKKRMSKLNSAALEQVWSGHYTLKQAEHIQKTYLSLRFDERESIIKRELSDYFAYPNIGRFWVDSKNKRLVNMLASSDYAIIAWKQNLITPTQLLNLSDVRKMDDFNNAFHYFFHSKHGLIILRENLINLNLVNPDNLDQLSQLITDQGIFGLRNKTIDPNNELSTSSKSYVNDHYFFKGALFTKELANDDWFDYLDTDSDSENHVPSLNVNHNTRK